MPKLSRRNPGSLVQLLLVLFFKTLEAMMVEFAKHEVALANYCSGALLQSCQARIFKPVTINR
jgi:hypothetical protein